MDYYIRGIYGDFKETDATGFYDFINLLHDKMTIKTAENYKRHIKIKL